MGDIAISNGVRSNLTALQSTAKMMEQTQNRLSTGKRVNSAIDNPANFFTASSMDNRASDLGSLLDSMKTGVNTIKAADNALTAITKLVESAQGTARQALQDASTADSQASVTGSLDIGGSGTQAATLATDLTTVFDATDILSFTVTDENGVDHSADLTIVASGDNDTAGEITTVEDLVNAVNSQLGTYAEMSVGSDGTLTLEGKSGNKIDMTATDTDAVTTTNTLEDLFGTAATITADATAGGHDATLTDLDLTLSAPTSTENETRTKLAAQFDEIRTQIDELAKDAEFNGINLLDGDDLKVVFNEKTGSDENSLTMTGVTFNSAGLGISATSNDFQADADIDTALTQLSDALSTLRTQASTFGSDLSTVEVRQDFTMAMVNTLEQGASDLTLADTNREGANMLALQTSQSLATTTMGMAASADQAVLSFLR